jgi:RNA polymerase sigma-54 factor
MKMGQQMKLAPRMIQSMEILQMPLAELEERIEQELESNPTLELSDGEGGVESEGGGEEGAEGRGGSEDDVAGGRDGVMGEDGGGESGFARLEEFSATNPDAAENSYEGSSRVGEGWEEARGEYSASRSAGERDAKLDAMAAAPARAASLTDQLLEQWGLAEVDARTRALGEQLILFLDEDGFLRTPVEQVADRAPQGVKELGATAADWELALQTVQYVLEPAGVGARDAAECLLLQLDALEEARSERGEWPAVGGGAVEAARVLISGHFEDLMKNRLPKIAARSGLSLEEINAGVEVMRRLSLAPARRLVEKAEAAVRPDAVVEYDEENDRYVAYLAETRASQLRINREYALMSKDKGVAREDREFLKKNLSNAQWLLDAVGQRRQTMLRVLTAVVDEQRDYFDYGPGAIRPLPMKTIADRLGIHVATVSRAVAEKWVQTPRGVVAMRGFFTQGMATESGEEVATEEIRGALKEIIEAEDKARPFSDDALVSQLKARGYEIARRTVAKYRDQLEIPPARMRKQF